MDLDTQIITIIFSFLYGIFFGFFLHINCKIIYHEKKYIKYIGSFLVILINVLLYFLILKQINYAIFHPYCLIVLTLGFYIHHIIVKQIKKWYTKKKE